MDGLVIINDLATGTIVEVNPAFCRMHGYRRDELIGTLPTSSFIPTTTRCSPTTSTPSSTGTSSGPGPVT